MVSVEILSTQTVMASMALVLALGLTGCSSGSSCAELQTKIDMAQMDVTAADAQNSIDGQHGSELTQAQTTLDELTREYVQKGCS